MKLVDDAARRQALSDLDHSFLVEAGAGSGKTAVMAGRIALLMASGVPPRSIAAVTFTELAASELLGRVRDFMESLARGTVPIELKIALQDGLSVAQVLHVQSAMAQLDELTCSTIHGFCQKLVKPYPVEAGLDPGATLMDKDEADRMFEELFDDWIREELDNEGNLLLAALIEQDVDGTLKLLGKICGPMRAQRGLSVRGAEDVEATFVSFFEASAAFVEFYSKSGLNVPSTAEICTVLGDFSTALSDRKPWGAESAAIEVLRMELPLVAFTKGGTLRKYAQKGKWVEAGKSAALSKSESEQRFGVAASLYNAIEAAWSPCFESLAASILSGVVEMMHPLVQRFSQRKRQSALMDFDDLIYLARELLRKHSPVREALARRYSYLLVDEFQDTDPAQTEIFWRLSGEPPGNGSNEWDQFRIRAGALFLVGDPKQAIYRFRGADVGAYILARQLIIEQHEKAFLSIATNFRSFGPIIDYVNARFSAPLDQKEGQPGFTPLSAFRKGGEPPTCVSVIEVTSEVGEDGKGPGSGIVRQAEAVAVAELCESLIGRFDVIDRVTGTARRCRPGDIALLSPQGTELWRYESELEQRGIAVATQAGKGFFRRQEVQDLIALTSALADSRDRLALGALLRGPLVGLSDEALLDIVCEQPRSSETPEEVRSLSLNIEAEAISNPLARTVIEILQHLTKKKHSTSPHALLSEAVDRLRVRHVLALRHPRHADRALANVDLYLDMARSYAVRGLRSFADAMRTAWSDESKTQEGRPDAQEEAVALFSIHSSKGLEWPIVVLVNSLSRMVDRNEVILNQRTGVVSTKVFGVSPPGHTGEVEAEQTEIHRERVRLWYVAATRARERLIIPRHNAPIDPNAWITLAPFDLKSLPWLDLSELPARAVSAAPEKKMPPEREQFVEEAHKIVAAQHKIEWITPSRGEEKLGVQVEDATEFVGSSSAATVQGGMERGLILHKMMEDVLNKSVEDELSALTAHAELLIRQLGREVSDTPDHGLSPVELTQTVQRTLSIPAVAAVRARLFPEFPIYAADAIDNGEAVTSGVVDAIALGDDDEPSLVIDWKSDVSPAADVLAGYRAQVRKYLDATRVPRGLIVMMTTGQVIEVNP